MNIQQVVAQLLKDGQTRFRLNGKTYLIKTKPE